MKQSVGVASKRTLPVPITSIYVPLPVPKAASMENASTPKSKFARFDELLSGARSTTSKRDVAAANLERDPQSSTAKRQQRSQAFTSHMAHSSLERQLLAVQTAKNDLETKLRERDSKIETLEKDRRWLADREREEREEKERERAEHDQAQRQSDAEFKAQRNALTALQQEHADLKDAHSVLSRQSSHTTASLKSQVATLSWQTEVLQSEIAETKRVSDERSDTLNTLQQELDELNAAQDASMQIESEQESWSVVRAELQRQADYVRKLEAENTRMTSDLLRLRERHTSIEVLREEKRGLEQKLHRMDELRNTVTRLEAEVEAGRRERAEWAEKSASSSRSASAASVATLRLANATLLEEKGVTSALLRARELDLDEAETREEEARTTIEKLQTDVSRLKDRLARRVTRADLAEREVGFLKAMMASHTLEQAQENADQMDPSLNQRIQELEALLAEYKSTVLRYEQEIDAYGEDPSTLGQGRSRQALADELAQEREATAEAKKALDESTTETVEYLEKIEQLEQTLFELGGEIAGGRHVPPGIRVLAMKESPDQQWLDLRQAAMDRLRGENEALLQRLRDLESTGAVAVAGSSSQSMVPRESYEHLEVANKELEEQVRQKEKSRKRLQEIYAKKSAEFRETISNILGLKLAFYQNGQIRVTSIYDLNASFVFQPPKVEGTRVQLIGQGENGSLELQDLLEYWIGTEQCIPGFLASVSLQCYDKAKTNGTLVEDS